MCSSCCTRQDSLRFGMDRFWSLILIFLGVWLFARHWGLIGGNAAVCQCERCRTRKLMGPAMLVTIGRAVPARQHWTNGISQDLARDPAGDWCGQADAEQRFSGRAHRPAASGHGDRIPPGISVGKSTGCCTECCAGADPADIAEPRPGGLFRRGEKCLAHSRRTQAVRIQALQIQ